MIYYFTPYSTEKNIGKAYNDYCKIVPNDDDWICLMDGDIAFLHPQWGHDIEGYVKNKKEYDLLTAYTFRTRNRNQKYKRTIWTDTNIIRLWQESQKQSMYIKDWSVKPVHSDIAGFLMLFRKSLWNEIPFPEDKILGIDTAWSMNVLRAKKRIGVMEKIVCFHYYRHHKPLENVNHLK